MIAAHIAEQLRRDANRVALRLPERNWTYAELLGSARAFESRLSPLAGGTIGILGEDLPLRVVGLLAADLFGLEPCLFPTGMSRAISDDWSSRLGLADCLQSLPSESSVLDNAEAGEVSLTSQGITSLWLFTSGTTGPPQPVQHTWQALTSAVHTGPRYQRRRWLLAYDPASFAGLQVAFQALFTGGTLSDVSQATAAEAGRRLVDEQVEFASGTPTFWRMLLGAVDASYWHTAKLEQITLGGESVSEGTLSALRAAFPQARLSHIYATSELGVCFGVTDGRAGFPAEYLKIPPAHCQLRIAEDGELEVRSAHCAVSLLKDTADGANSADQWHGTADLVELRDDRVYFVGRKSGVIHVGGGKVVPEEVEAVIRNVAGVAEVRVSAQASSVLGAIVRADVVLKQAAEPAQARSAILTACKTQLPRHKVPAMVEFHSVLPRTPSGKLARNSTP